MDTHSIFSTSRTAVITLSLAMVLAGCKAKSPANDDASLTSQVQARLASDQNLSGQPIQASVTGGVVTLSGSVTDATARSIAGQDVAQVAGVRTVVDNLVVGNSAGQAPAYTTAVTRPPAPVPTEPVRKPSPMLTPRTQTYTPAPIVRNGPAPQPDRYPAPAQTQMQSPPPPPPPAAPVVHNLTLASGAAIPVRITQTLDSATTQAGDKFTGAIASDIVIDGMVALAQGTPVTGRVDAVQDAAHFKGSSLITISLTSVSRRGERIDVATDAYTKQGEGRGKNTAEKVGGGAAVGAILGGILGGGKGAAIGSVAGGGIGAGAQAATRGQQVQIPSETVVRFRLANSIVVRTTTGSGGSGSYENSGPALERRNDSNPNNIQR